MTKHISDISQRKAARVIGFSFLIMLFLAIFAILFVLSNLIVPGDAAKTTKNIKANHLLFIIAIASYFIILTLDVVVALTLYVVLKPVNKNLALLMTLLRVVYAAIMGISLFALMLLFVNAYIYGELIAYIFFISHLSVLGYLVFKSGYIPRILGVLLIIASFSYFIIQYGNFILPKNWYEVLYLITYPAAFAEIYLGIWLLIKSVKISKMIEEKMNKSEE